MGAWVVCIQYPARFPCSINMSKSNAVVPHALATCLWHTRSAALWRRPRQNRPPAVVAPPAVVVAVAVAAARVQAPVGGGGGGERWASQPPEVVQVVVYTPAAISNYSGRSQVVAYTPPRNHPPPPLSDCARVPGHFESPQFRISGRGQKSQVM